MKVRHATLLNVFGRPAKHGGFTFVPASIELESAHTPSHSLADLPANRIPPILRAPIANHYDVSWVRARLPHAFGISPEPSENEKTLLEAAFVAVPEGQSEAIGFGCSDYYGKTSLFFSEAEDELSKETVANAFWNVLLSEPDSLEDFSASVMHLGAPVTLHFGCERGEPFFQEEPH